MSKQFTWAAQPLAVDEQKLVAAYEKIGKPLDLLPYTDDFDHLLRDLDIESTDESRREVFHRLLNLRKKALLPRTSNLINVSREGMPLSADDEELLAAYDRIGRPLDALPYTEDFDKLLDELGKSRTQAIKHAALQRLLHLRKRGRLPSMTFNISFVVAPDHLIKTAEQILGSTIRCADGLRRDIHAVAKAYVDEATKLKHAVREIQTGGASFQIESRSPAEMIQKAIKLQSVRLANKEMQGRVRKVASSYVLIARKNQELFDDFKRKYSSFLPPAT
jgi:hypothetical protein